MLCYVRYSLLLVWQSPWEDSVDTENTDMCCDLLWQPLVLPHLTHQWNQTKGWEPECYMLKLWSGAQGPGLEVSQISPVVWTGKSQGQQSRSRLTSRGRLALLHKHIPRSVVSWLPKACAPEEKSLEIPAAAPLRFAAAWGLQLLRLEEDALLWLRAFPFHPASEAEEKSLWTLRRGAGGNYLWLIALNMKPHVPHPWSMESAVYC